MRRQTCHRAFWAEDAGDPCDCEQCADAEDDDCDGEIDEDDCVVCGITLGLGPAEVIGRTRGPDAYEVAFKEGQILNLDRAQATALLGVLTALLRF